MLAITDGCSALHPIIGKVALRTATSSHPLAKIQFHDMIIGFSLSFPGSIYYFCTFVPLFLPPGSSPSLRSSAQNFPNHVFVCLYPPAHLLSYVPLFFFIPPKYLMVFIRRLLMGTLTILHWFSKETTQLPAWLVIKYMGLRTVQGLHCFKLKRYDLVGSFQLVIASLLHHSSLEIVTCEGHPFNSSSPSSYCINNQYSHYIIDQRSLFFQWSHNRFVYSFCHDNNYIYKLGETWVLQFPLP